MNQYSVTSAGLGEGLARSASALELAGNTFEEAAALIGATSEVTQDPEKAGNAMKTVSMRLRGMKGELEELGEESEGVENISQMQGKILNLTHGAVNIFDNQGEFRSTYDILMDIADVYQDLTSTEQADLLETIAGKNRANDVAAFLSNAENAAGMVEAAENSAGSAAAENAKYLESLQGRITSLQASLQTLSASFLSSDFLGGAVAGVNAFIQSITGVINMLGPIPSLMLAVGTAMSVMDKGPLYFDNTTKQVKILGNSLSELKSIFSSLGSGDKVGALASSFGDDDNPLRIIDQRIEQEKAAIKKYNSLLSETDKNGTKKYTPEQASAIAFEGQAQSLKDYAEQWHGLAISMDDYEKKSKSAALQTMAQSNSFKSGIMILDDYNKKTKEQRVEMSKMTELSGSNVGNYLSGLKGADASIGGLAKTTVLATAKTIAMDAAFGLAQGGLMALGSMALDFAINGLMSIINRADEVKTAVEDATQSFANNKKQLSDNKQSFADAAQTYAELSSGVSKTGENLSLSASQYDEYAEAVNTIADMTPSLVSGYDAQGNAILNTKGNVEALTDAYNDLIIAENNKLLNGDGEDFGGLSDISEDLANDTRNLEGQRSVAEHIEDLLKMPDISNESILDTFGATIRSDAQKIKAEIEAAGKEIEGSFDIGLFGDFTTDSGAAAYIQEAAKQYPELLRGMVSNYESALDSSVSEMRSAMSAHMETAFLTDQYANIDDETYAMASNIVNGIDSAMIAKLNGAGGEEGKQAVMNYVDNIMSAFDTAMSDTQRQQFEDAFNLSDAFQEGDVSLGEYKKQLEDVSAMIDSLNVNDDVKNQLKLSLNVDEVQQQYDELYNYLTQGADEKGREAAKGLIDGLNSEEMTVALDMVADGEIDVSDLNVDSVRQKIQDEVERQRILNFELDIEVETDSLDKLNTAISESNGAMGLAESSIDAVISRYADLEGYDPAALFEKTTTGVRLNEEALEALETQYVKTNKASQQQKIDALVQEYMRLQDAINSTTDAQEKETNQNRLADIEEEIQEAQTLMSAYDGLTSAYKNWIDSQSSGQSGDMYRQMLEGRENAVALANEGRWGNTELQDYIKMFSAEGSLDNATPQQYADAWADAIYKANRYLTEGQEGANRFFQDLYDKGSQLIEMNEDGSFTIKPGVEVEDLAREGEVANSTVESIVGNLQEYGADIQIGIDEKSVDELVADAKAATQQAEDVLKQSLGQDFELGVDVNVESVEDADSKLQELQSQKDQINNDPTIDVTAKQTGLDAIDSQIKAIIAQKVQLEQPSFMSIDVSSVDEGMQDALSYAQQFQSAMNEVSVMQMQEQFGIDVDDSQLQDAIAKVDSLAQEIADNKDLKVKLGFEEGATAEEIKAAFSPENIPEIEAKFNVDSSQVQQAVDSATQDQTIDVSVNLSNDDKVAALESKMNAIDNKTIDVSVSMQNDDAVAALESKMNAIDNKVIHVSVAMSNDNSVAALESKMNAIDNKVIDASVSLTNDGSIAALESKMNAIDNKVIHVSVSAQNTQAVTALQSAINSIQGRAISINVATTGTDAVYALQNAINAVSGKQVVVAATVTGTQETNALKAAIDSVYNKSVTVSAAVYGTSSVNSLAGAIANVRSKTVTVTTRTQTIGVGQVNGTAHADGTARTNNKAFKQGSWGTKESGVALMGELGPEIIVRGDKWFTVGDNGAGFYQYKKGDIIFNHIQAKELLENGYVSSSGGRGRAFVEGTAFASISGSTATPKPAGGGSVTNITNNYNYNYNTSKPASSSSKKSSSSAKKEAEEFKETLDWIEIAIDRVERAIDSLDKTATNTFLDFAERDGALLQQMQQVTNEINLQQQAYERYMAEANSVGLSADWQDKVKNGRIDIEVITDEGLKEQIDQFQEWYEKALDAKDALDDLNITISELNKQRWDTLIDEFELYLNRIQNSGDMIEEIVNRAEVDGQIISKNYYTELQNNKHAEAEMLREERKRLIALRDEMVNNGSMEVMSDEWYAMNNQIDEITVSIYECQTAWAEYQKSIRETEWKVFDILQDRITGVADEAQFLIDLMSNEKLFEDNGQLTDKGWATMGLYGQQYNVYMNKADRYAEEIKKLEDQMANDPYLTGDGAYNMDVIDRYYELIEAQQEAILSAEDMKNSIKDMVQEGIELELDALDDLISKYMDALQAQKDLYDYENEIREKTDDIAMLEKQLSAYAGDDSEESKATIQELTEQLTEAQRDLQDAEYERQISDVERLLDQMRLDYETVLNARLDNIDMLIEQMIAEINANAGSISETISSEAQGVGYQLSDEMQNIWNGANNVLATYGDQFLSNGTTIAHTLEGINTGIQNMISKLDAIAQQKIEEAKQQQAGNIPVTQPTPAPAPAPTPAPAPAPAPQPEQPKQVTVGGMINAGGARIYADSEGHGGGRQYFANDPVYFVLQKRNGYVLARWHGLSSGNTGWFRESDVSALAKGKRLIDEDQLAWTQENGAEMIVRPSDGAILTPLAKNDSVLNAAATQNIWDMANDPSGFVRDNLGIGGSSVSPAATGGNTNITQNLESVVFSLPNVRNYDELIRQMQKDRNFERLINSMTLDKIAGKNSLSKSKAIR